MCCVLREAIKTMADLRIVMVFIALFANSIRGQGKFLLVGLGPLPKNSNKKNKKWISNKLISICSNFVTMQEII